MKDLKLKSFGQLQKIAVHYLPVILLVCGVFVVLIVSCWFIFRMGLLAYGAQFEDPEAKTPKPVLVNMDGYKAASERVGKGRDFVPAAAEKVQNPFLHLDPAVDQ